MLAAGLQGCIRGKGCKQPAREFHELMKIRRNFLEVLTEQRSRGCVFVQ